jgi:hypothetical protein
MEPLARDASLAPHIKLNLEYERLTAAKPESYELLWRHDVIVPGRRANCRETVLEV